MLKAVIFDIDGTLIDSVDQHAASWLETFRHFAVEATFKDVRAQIGKGGDQLLPVFVSPERLEREGEAMERFRSDLFKRDYLPTVRGFPGVRPLFERLMADGRQVWLGTSGNKDEADRYAQIAGIADMVDGMATKSDAERSKPAPDVFQAALRKLAPVSADETIVIGDTPYDAQAARKAGLRTIGVRCGGWGDEELKAAGCVAVFDGTWDLLARYRESPLMIPSP